MLKEKMFSLALPDGAPERLATHCDVRGNGFPMMEGIASAAFKRKARLRDLAIAAGAPPARLAPPTRFPSPPPFRGTPKSLDGELLVGPPRPGTRGKSLTPLRTPPSGQRLPTTVDSPHAARLARTHRLANELRKSALQMSQLGRAILDVEDIAQGISSMWPGRATPRPAFGPEWIKVCGQSWTMPEGLCSEGMAGRWSTTASSSTPLCGIDFQPVTAALHPNRPIGETQRTVAIGPRNPAFCNRMDLREQWYRPNNGPKVQILPQAAPRYAPAPDPAVGGRPVSGYLPKWALKEWQRTSTDVEVGPEPRTRTRDDRPLPPRPPKLRVRERKYRDDGAPTRLGRYHGTKVEKLFHWITEADDAIDIAYDALSGDVRAAYGCQGDLCKLNAIASNLDKMDWEKLGVDLVKNDIEDRLVGGAHGLAEGKGKPQNLGLGLGQFR